MLASESEPGVTGISPPKEQSYFSGGDAVLIGEGTHRFVFIVDGSRLYQISSSAADLLGNALEDGDPSRIQTSLKDLGFNGESPHIRSGDFPRKPATTTLSLAVAQKCNLGCTYCYAQEGDFGGAAKNMPLEVARASVDRLLNDAGPGERVHLSFLGGEPLVNRSVLREATEDATRQATAKGAGIGFSVTTNGTLLTEDDSEFFEQHGFAVTISLDGIGGTHDRLRPTKGGNGSYERIIQRVKPLLTMQRRMQVSARVTVTPRNLDLRETLDEFVALGFHSVGFSPMLSSPTSRDEMEAPHLDAMLEQMINCGKQFEKNVIAGRRYPFSNMATAMQEIHKGTHRPYPCGAGAGYLGVSAEGGLFACHRFVDDEQGSMGDLKNGVDPAKQEKWLSDRHVHFQEPCSGCWARYLCGGGCHHEVIHRGRPACDYIRGWLHYCLQAYVRLQDERPDYFGPGS